MSVMGFLFDTNIFIRSKNEMPSDVWPTFWRQMSVLVNSGDVCSSEKVKEEINNGGDELTQWMRDNVPDSFFYPIDEEVIGKYEEVQRWANDAGRFSVVALNEFASVADAYIVATAAAKDLTVVTYEVPSPGSKKRVKIPDACVAMGVKYCDLNTVFRELRVQI